jgi:hypothetical protein
MPAIGGIMSPQELGRGENDANETAHQIEMKENAKWSQNPQFLLRLNDLFSKEELHIKIVVKRIEKKEKEKDREGTVANSSSSGIGGGKLGAGPAGSSNTAAFAAPAAPISSDKVEANVSFVVCKPNIQEELNLKKKKAGPRENALGQVL